MTLVRWDPFKDVSSLQERINRMFEDFFPQSNDLVPEKDECAWQPVVDVYETEKGLVIQAELPGVKKEDISVELKNNVLTFRGQRTVESQSGQPHYHRRERCFGTFQRSFTLRETIPPDQIKARFKDGVLELEVPKAEDQKPRSIKVSVE